MLGAIPEPKVNRPKKSYGRRKLDLIQHGLCIPEEVRRAPEVAAGLVSGRPGEEVTLSLAPNFIVKVVLKEDDRAALKLKAKGGTVFLEGPDGDEEVGVVPLPNFLKEQYKERTPVSENVCLDGYCLNLFLRLMGNTRQLSMGEETVLKIIQSAFEEAAADLVQINMDYNEEPDRGFLVLEPLIQLIKRNFKTFVGLKGFPPIDRQVVDRIYSAGIDLLNFPLEGFAGASELTNIVPAHRVHEALEYSVGVFPQGAVWTEMVVGADPDPVKRKIDYLIPKGIVPLLKLQAASITTGREYDVVDEVVRYLDQAAQRERLNRKWLYPNCRCVTPLDTAFYLHGDTAKLAVTPVYRSILGKKASEGFAALRRRLRIKNVSDSYESAGL